MPLDFLKRKDKAAKPAENAAPASALMPEEVLAQDHLLKLYYAGKSSEGVRMKAGPAAVRELPSMLVGLARSEIEIVEPLPIEFSQATPTIVTPSEAMQWLNAHHARSPITRHALGLTRIERPVPAAGRGGLVCAHCGFASGHERAFYWPKCGMRLLRG